MGYPNRFESRCIYCAGTVPAGEGDMWKWKGRYYVCHKQCGEEKKLERKASKSSPIDTFVIGGKEYTRNKKGRCEDAPCCGCCTI
jgi:hypothetical protein